MHDVLFDLMFKHPSYMSCGQENEGRNLFSIVIKSQIHLRICYHYKYHQERHALDPEGYRTDECPREMIKCIFLVTICFYTFIMTM